MNAPVRIDQNSFGLMSNPIIGQTPIDTLYQAACAVEFLGRMHGDLADWQSLAAGSDICGPENLLANERRGLSVLCSCIASALNFEVDGRSSFTNPPDETNSDSGSKKGGAR